MSGKYAKKNKSGLVVLILALAMVAAVTAVLLLNPDGFLPETTTEQSWQEQTGDPQNATGSASGLVEQEKVSFVLSQGLEITGLGSYTGVYMEDGSNELVSDILMIRVTNTADASVQYAQITLSGGAGEAHFTLSTLKPGETAVLLEMNRKPYSAAVRYDSAEASNVAVFPEEPVCHEDRIRIQPLDGGFNITNISDEDITGDIVVYFKNYANGLYYGGITYRGRIEGGLRAGELRQIMSANFSAEGTAVVFVTIAEG